jgi:glycosyltransferase involved in cell wall biosynthesis
MNIAIVADWLPTYGGAEHVVAAFHGLWPDAPLFTTVASKESLGPLRHAEVHCDPVLQFLYRCIHRHQYLLPWMPRALERIDLRGFDVVLSSSHAVAKGIVPSQKSVHICYCHTPMRYAWEMEEEYLRDFRIRGYLRKKIKAELKRLRRWDLSTVRRVDRFIANSTETQQRIERIYGRDSIVIPPPVEERFFQTSIPAQPSTLNPQPYFLALGRLVPYKRFDLLIELANALRLPLKIGGVGSDATRLRSLAGPTVEFLEHVDDAALPSLYAHAACLLFPQIEDAGIVPLEAQASGVPVVAYGRGGILDVIRHRETGLFVGEQTVEAFSAAVRELKSIPWNRSEIRRAAEHFSLSHFQKRIAEEVQEAYERFHAVIS